ncbi:flagellar hook-length control protein FliK, partial [Vibrio diabolicus]|uniref:flagellar hook-length control protein FliK n=2 Tax=Vibrionaceae TaxID=641 RepID=UPI002150EFEF
ANEQVAEKVQMMMSKNLKNLDIRLDPPELGRMQIRMTMNNDVANVHFTVNNTQARDIIEQTLPRLREMLAQQGMQLADSSV